MGSQRAIRACCSLSPAWSEAEAEKLLDHPGRGTYPPAIFKMPRHEGVSSNPDLDELKTGQRLLAENSSDPKDHYTWPRQQRRQVTTSPSCSIKPSSWSAMQRPAATPCRGRIARARPFGSNGWGERSQLQSLQTEPLIRRALDIVRSMASASKHLDIWPLSITDGIGMLVDAKGHSHTAEQQRRAALEIAERVHGQVNEKHRCSLDQFGRVPASPRKNTMKATGIWGWAYGH